jgi:hypothetical protein
MGVLKRNRTRRDEQLDKLPSRPTYSQARDEDEGQKLPVVLVVHCPSSFCRSVSQLGTTLQSR